MTIHTLTSSAQALGMASRELPCASRAPLRRIARCLWPRQSRGLESRISWSINGAHRLVGDLRLSHEATDATVTGRLQGRKPQRLLTKEQHRRTHMTK